MCALAVGIDLGTTNSCVGVFRDGKVEIIQNEHFTYVIPSYVTFADGEILTGHEAKDSSHLYTQNSIFEVKRLIGQSYEHQDVQNYIEKLPYKVVQDDGLLKIEVDHQGESKLYFPEEISAYVLQKLKDLAESNLRQNVNKVVITVPARFNDVQREATKFAATIAGFSKDNVHIINEPTAAALAFNYESKKRYRRNVLVYDFGGGTFDVSIVILDLNECIVKATKGDLHLGGTDIDANLVSYVKENFKVLFEEEMTESPEDIRRLNNTCERVKIKLSGTKLDAEIDLNNLSGKDYFSVISREKFEELNASLFEKTLKIVEECIDSSGFTKDEIDEVILVGGSSRIPKVQQMLEEYFGADKIKKGINPDEAVAYGAAIHATCLMGNKSEVKDVNSLSLGIAVLGILSSVIIPCNTSIPTKATQRYQTALNNQTEADIVVYQGEELFVKSNAKLGQFTLTELRRAPAGDVKIDVCFEIDAEGILNVVATEAGVENEKKIKIDVKKIGLTAEQLQQRRTELEEHRRNELRKRAFLDEVHCLERLCQEVSESIADVNEGGSRCNVLGKCDEICEWLKNVTLNDQEEVEAKKKELEELCEVNSLVLGNSSMK